MLFGISMSLKSFFHSLDQQTTKIHIQVWSAKFLAVTFKKKHSVKLLMIDNTCTWILQ